MSDQILHVVLVVISVAFSAGAFSTYMRLTLARLRAEAKGSHQQLLKDIDGVADFARITAKDVARRHLNMSLAILVAVPADKELEITALLKEG